MPSRKIDRDQADSIASKVFRRLCEALDEAKRLKKLDALAYSTNSHEKWLVFETYSLVFRDWAQVVPAIAADEWDCRMEMLLPKQAQPRKHVDMVVGPVEPFPQRPGYWHARRDAPVFEFKIIRDDDWNDNCRSARADAEKLRQAGLQNGYLFVLHFMVNEAAGLSDSRREFRKKSPVIESLCCDGVPQEWGPYKPDLSQWVERKPGYFAEAFRVNPVPR
jgi:hypothetical protein